MTEMCFRQGCSVIMSGLMMSDWMKRYTFGSNVFQVFSPVVVFPVKATVWGVCGVISRLCKAVVYAPAPAVV